jgi:hypothetical protein
VSVSAKSSPRNHLNLQRSAGRGRHQASATIPRGLTALTLLRGETLAAMAIAGSRLY